MVVEFVVHDVLEVSQVLRRINIFDALDGFGTIGQSCHDLVVRSCCRVRDVFVLKLDCVTDPFTPRCFDMAFVGSIMFVRRR